jgi:hypothetical protein
MMMSKVETSVTNSLSMRTHEVEALREKIKALEAELSDMRKLVPTFEDAGVQRAKLGACISPPSKEVEG